MTLGATFTVWAAMDAFPGKRHESEQPWEVPELKDPVPGHIPGAGSHLVLPGPLLVSSAHQPSAWTPAGPSGNPVHRGDLGGMGAPNTVQRQLPWLRERVSGGSSSLGRTDRPGGTWGPPSSHHALPRPLSYPAYSRTGLPGPGWRPPARHPRVVAPRSQSPQCK